MTQPYNRALASTNWRSRPSPLAPGSTGNSPAPSANNEAWGSIQERERRLRREEKQKLESRHEIATSSRIHVSNLMYTATKKDVQNLFEDTEFKVSNIDMRTHPFTHYNPTYCFVDFADAKTTESAITAMNEVPLLGLPIKTRPWDEKQDSTGRTFHNRRNTEAPPDNADVGPLVEPEQQPLLDTAPTPKQETDSTIPGRHSRTKKTSTTIPTNSTPILQRRRLYFDGLPEPPEQETTEGAMRSLFQDFNVQAAGMQGMPGNRYLAFVDFESQEEAESAVLVMNGRKMWGGVLRVGLHWGLPVGGERRGGLDV